MNHSSFNLVAMALAMSLFAPVALAQKPTNPAPAPPSKPTQPAAPSPLQPTQPIQQMDLVLFLHGQIKTNDGSSLPNDVLVERICNNRVRQQVYASPHGDFSMQLGTRFDSFVDASAEPTSQDNLAKRALTDGVPRRDLLNCELKATVAGFRSKSVSLMELMPSESAIDVGAIVVERTAKVKGTTLSAMHYKAPPLAQKAFEKGLAAENNDKLADARKYFEQALDIYPRYASAWFQLGKVCEQENQVDSARAAYMKATNVDSRFAPPRLALAAMYFRAENWTEVVQLTGYIIENDLLNHGDVAGYILDLDEVYPAEPYFYNAVANFKLSKFEEAEKSALKAERVDLRTNFPQLHVLLAEVFARKQDYAAAITQLHTYLELAPKIKDEDQVRAYLAKLERLNHAAATSEKPIQN